MHNIQHTGHTALTLCWYLEDLIEDIRLHKIHEGHERDKHKGRKEKRSGI